MLKAFQRPDERVHESQLILGEIENYIKEIEEKIEEVKKEIILDQQKLQSLTLEIDNTESKGEIQRLFGIWKKLKDEVANDSYNIELQEQLKFAEEDLSAEADRDSGVFGGVILEVKQTRAAISQNSSFLKDFQQALADWEVDKNRVLVDIQALKEWELKFKQLFESKN